MRPWPTPHTRSDVPLALFGSKLSRRKRARAGGRRRVVRGWQRLCTALPVSLHLCWLGLRGAMMCLDARFSRFCAQTFQWVFFQNTLVLWLVQIAYQLSISAANVVYSLTWQVLEPLRWPRPQQPVLSWPCIFVLDVTPPSCLFCRTGSCIRPRTALHTPCAKSLN